MEDEAITATADLHDTVSAPAGDAATGEASSGESEGLTFESYSATLSESQRELFTKNGVDSFEKQEKWIEGLNSMIGKKGLVEPGEDASDEEKQAYRNQLLDKMGRPEDGSYKWDLPEGAREEVYGQEVVDKLATFAHKHGLNNEGYQEAINMLNEFMTPLLGEWDKTIGEINARLGEDKMDDRATSNATVNRDSLRKQGQMKMAEATELWSTGDFKGAEQLQKEAKELYSQYGNL